MKKRFMMSILCVGLVACQSEMNENAPPDNSPYHVEWTVAEQEIAKQVNVFAFDFLRTAYAHKLAYPKDDAPQENMLLSPLSASLALAMLNNGAGGQTQAEIQQTLGYGAVSESEMNAYFQKMTEVMRQVDPDVAFESANSIWLQLNFSVLDAFKEVNVAHYEAEIRNVDFSDRATNVLINNWCSEKTHGKIPEIVDEKESLGQLLLCLLNALYFKGTWTLPFDKSKTRPATFRNEDGSVSPVQMMEMEKTLNYSCGSTFDLLELPYGNEAFAMDLLLPHEGVSLSEVVESLKAEQWTQTVAALQPATLSVQLPRFKIEYKRMLNRDLHALGMASLFNGAGDLSRIHPELSAGVDVSVFQKTYAEVNEEGTEAAAVTIVTIDGSVGGLPAVPPTFHFDRPFVFLIREKTGGAIFFTGIVRSLKE